MTFLNNALAFGAAAFAIPLIIHILNRSRFRTVQWGAMHLLESVIKVNHRKFHIEQILLLLIRCAIPILLAFCLARPVLTDSKVMDADTPVSLVILLDTSYSMDAMGAAGSRFDEAVTAASDIVKGTASGSEIAVIRTGGTPVPLFDQPVFDSEAVIRGLRRIEGGYGASDMQAALDAGLSTLSGMAHARRELVIISDFQTTDWQAVGLSRDSIQNRIRDMEIRPDLTLLKVGSGVSGNVAVESLDYSQRALGVGQQLSVRANLRNYGSEAYDHARVILKIDGVEHAVSQVALEADGSSQTLFPCSFDASGSHVMEVEVVTDDALSTDNRISAAVSVWDNIQVLLVDGQPGSRPLKGSTDFLSIALTPFTFGRVRLTDLVETKTVPLPQLTPDSFAGFRVVVLANVSQLTDEQLAALSTFVQEGGALLVCAGNRIDLNWYREKFHANGSGPLPAPFGALQGRIDDRGQSTRIVTQHFDHPALEFFNDPANGDLSTVEIRQWHDLTTTIDTSAETSETRPDNATVSSSGMPSPSTAPPAPLVIARLETGHPLLLEKRFGDGVVVQLATTCNDDWTDLPLRPVFVPLMQQLVSTMADRVAPPRNIATGEPAVAMVNRANAESSQENPASPTPISVVTPEGSRRTIQTQQEGNIEFATYSATQRPGVYTMTLPSTETVHFVATTSRHESDLTTADETSLATLATQLTAGIVESAEQYREQDRLRRHGSEIWRFLLFALLVFMFLEVLLQQRFARAGT